jgi:hypothetical protein
MKQTAVEWLESKILGDEKFSLSKWLKQAKEMEKEQIESAFNYAQIDLGMEADEYYNLTFKSE